MRILITNDDGFFQEGIRVLEKALIRYGHEVYCVAPHLEQSAKSHAMTVSGNITVWKHDDHHYSMEGTPADCVIYTIKSNLLGTEPDMVVSGINNGYNLSSDTIYSGTCAAARQGTMYGYPSIALSSQKDEDGVYDFEAIAEYASSRLEEYYALLKGASSFLNINFPPHWNGRVEKASLGVIEYNDVFSVSGNGRKLSMKFDSCSVESLPSPDGCDYESDWDITHRGSASITPIRINPLHDESVMEKLKL